MLVWLAPFLAEWWGPFRLLGSHLVLLVAGTLAGGLIIWSGLPRLWRLLPCDRGKSLSADGGKRSKGKPTGAGFILSALMLPLILLVAPLTLWDGAVLLCLYMSMLFGYLDDRSLIPWGELKKGLLDGVVSLITAYALCQGSATEIWLPFVKQTLLISPWIYIPLAACLLWFTMNATNCSDGVDGLAGSLTLLSLFALAGLLYGVVGYRPIAEYLLLPHYPQGARWAIIAATMAGALAGYLWHNAEPSRVLMGDAGSRFFGLLVGIAVLVAGNPVLIFVVAPVVMVNGGTGLFKLGLLRILKKIGFNVRRPDSNGNNHGNKQFVLVKMLHTIRFPLHDHCRGKMQWSNAQVLMRFVLLQSFLTPLLFVILIKIR